MPEHPTDVHRDFADADSAISRTPLVGFLGAADAVGAVASYRSQLVESLELRTGDTVLDVGCGPGTHTAAVADAHDGPVIGLDRGSMIEEAWAQHPGSSVRWTIGDAARIPLDDDAVDAVFAERVLMYVVDAPAVVAEMMRVLRPGGRIALFELDYAGMVLGGDPDTSDAVHEVVCATVNDDRMGRRLGPLLADAGAADVRVHGLALPIPPPLFTAAVARPARAAVDAGRLAQRGVTEWLEECERRTTTKLVPGMLAAARHAVV